MIVRRTFLIGLIAWGICGPAGPAARSAAINPADMNSATGADPSKTPNRPSTAAPASDIPPIEILGSVMERPPIPADSLHFSVEQVTKRVLPFQAVLVRATIVNRTDRIVGPIGDLDLVVRYRNSEGVVPFREADLSPLRLAWYFPFIRLGPGQKLALDLVLGRTTESRYSTKGELYAHETVTRPIIFDEERPAFEVTNRGVLTGKESYLTAVLHLRRAEPTDVDRACFEFLRGDPRSARPLYDVQAPWEPSQIESLQRVVAKWPTSSYADYARFALARARLGNCGERLPELAECRPLPAPHERNVARGSIYFGLPERRITPLTSETEWKRLRRDASSFSPLPFRERFVGGIALRKATMAGYEERCEALRLLDAVRSTDFPFAAHVLWLKHRLAEIDEPERLPAITAEFDRRVPVASEWLSMFQAAFVANSVEATQAWVEYRIRTSGRSEGIGQ